eukprot:1567720-Lingulodinium_polyedra.AAC.1
MATHSDATAGNYFTTMASKRQGLLYDLADKVDDGEVWNRDIVQGRIKGCLTQAAQNEVDIVGVQKSVPVICKVELGILISRVQRGS